MAKNFDIRLDVDFTKHPKTRMLKNRLGSDGFYSLIELWLYCANFCPSGHLKGKSDEFLESAASWEGEKGRFVSTLRELGWVDGPELDSRIHDWDEHQPYASQLESRVAQSSRASRARWGKEEDDYALRRSGRVGHAPDAQAREEEDSATQKEQSPHPHPHTHPHTHTHTLDPDIRDPAGADPAQVDLEELIAGQVEREGPPKENMVNAVASAWSEGIGQGFAKAKPCGKGTEERDRLIAKALKKFPEPEQWKWCAKAISKDDFLRRWGRVNIAWLIDHKKGVTLEQWMAAGEELRAKSQGASKPPRQYQEYPCGKCGAPNSRPCPPAECPRCKLFERTSGTAKQAPGRVERGADGEEPTRTNLDRATDGSEAIEAWEDL